MSARPDGTMYCNGCGGALANDGVAEAVIVIAMVVNEDGGQDVENLHFCLRRDEARGLYRCAEQLLAPEVLRELPQRLTRLRLYEPPPLPAATAPAAGPDDTTS